MKEKIFLTSALAMGVFAPAFAAPSNTGEFPSTGLMQEDYTYTNAATEANMDGVYEDGATVDAVAEYTDILYNIVAGNYLKAGSDATNGTQCPVGSWCPGLTDATYNETDDQGINSCPSEYGLSAAGASSQNDCYRQCSGNVTIEHATGVTGNDYYGNGVDTCEPTGCENGWHVKAGVNGSAIASTIGTSEVGASNAYINNNGQFGEYSAAHGQGYYGINGNNTWAVDYGSDKGMLIGQGRCSTRAGASGTWANGTYNVIDDNFVSSLADETGQEGAKYCYCNVTGYQDTNGNLQSLSSAWVFDVDAYASSCASDCAFNCSHDMRRGDAGGLAFRAAVLGSVQPGLAMCEANTITINWSDASAADISANNAGTATYGSDVRTPVKAQTKKGKTFRGWRFSKPESVSVEPGNN